MSIVNPKQYQRRVVCAAARLNNPNGGEGIIVIGARPWDKWMRMQAFTLYRSHIISEPSALTWEPGFIDQDEKFMNVTEATHVAIAAGQVDPNDVKEGLSSHHLY